MPIYFAGTGESGDFNLFLLVLITGLALLVLFAWGIPWFRDTIHRRREQRLLDAEADTEQQDAGEEHQSLHWHSVSTK